ncbi:uncharacterized protein LOC130283045 [Hyla sarda]|uniref:uncharacterized protein LOC130283045 n=1 Tax=Hyla sarda TaxID=327740 RepID=UPI0024C20CC4|nr:uncharacterized protein LOC130283045 [Hyla sarda]
MAQYSAEKKIRGQTGISKMSDPRNHPEWTTNGIYTTNNNSSHSQTMTVKITMNGTKMEITAKIDPHSFYTILNEHPGKSLLGDEIEIATKSGKKKAYGNIVTGTIHIDDRPTSEQIIYVRTFPKTVIGWKQLRDLGLMQADTDTDFVVDVPPVRIEGRTDPGYFHQGYLYKPLIDDARRVIASWVRKGLIERCNSVCNAPISLSTKSNGKVKIHFKFRDLNECSEEEPPHPKFHVVKAIEAITLGKYYSVFKLYYAEWQIPLDTYTKYKTAFTFMGKQYVWNRLQGKYKNTMSRLSEALEKVLERLPQNLWKRVTYYTDTFLISAETKEECDTFTYKLMHHLQGSGFEISQTQKSKPIVSFLGKEISEDGIRQGKDFIQKVKNIKSPRDSHELKEILGLLNGAFAYTPGFSILSHRLYKLTSNKHKFHWDEKSESALGLLKKQVLLNRFVVPALTTKEPCTVEIFVKEGAWMAQILNSTKKPYRFDSGVLRPTKKAEIFAIQELKAMKHVWNKHRHVLECRDVEWEVESQEIAGYEDDLDSVPKRQSHNLDFLKTPGCKIKVVQGERKPPIPWPQNL